MKEKVGTDMAKKLSKECCCCGGDGGVWEQWWNRDKGYGLGVCCIDFCARGETIDSFEITYGLPYVHYEHSPASLVEASDG